MKTSFKIAIAQIAPILGELDKNIALHLEFIEKAKQQNAELILFPELGLSGYIVQDAVSDVAITLKKIKEDNKFKAIREQSKNISICFGFVEESEDYSFYNSAVYIENGNIVHYHRKIYPPTYGMFEELRYMGAGDKIGAFDTKFGRFGILICEDMWHPSCPYILTQDGAILILVLASSPTRGVNNTEKSDNMEIWERQNRFYAKAYGCYVVFANRVGFEDGINFWGGSEIIEPGAKLSAKAKYFEEELLICEVKESVIRQERIYSPLMRDEKLALTIDELIRIKNKKLQ